MDISIRTYQPSDKGTYIEFYAGIYKHIGTIDPHHRQKWEKENEEYLAMQEFDEAFAHEGEIFVATIGGEIVGMCMISIFQENEFLQMVRQPSKTGKIHIIYVKEEYRGKGIGQRLLSHAENFLKDEKHCDYLTLTVFGTNDTAHSLYKKNGFVDISIDMDKKLK